MYLSCTDHDIKYNVIRLFPINALGYRFGARPQVQILFYQTVSQYYQSILGI
jgi:hypothetical protein